MNDYIATMRKHIGNEMLLTVGCGMIIEDQSRRILLQRRKDEDNWCLPGGVMEVGETFLETAKRETLEETNLVIKEASLFGIYSGASCYAEYPNGDKTYSVQIIFHSKHFEGNLKQEGAESFEHRYYSKGTLPNPLNPRQKQFILDWEQGVQLPVIK
jgi:8-oxo-dGTP pyrophosphatase MutT (NUDIX family)